MAKLVLKANPTFTAKVGIPVAGEDKPADITFTFRHRTKDQVNNWTAAGGDDVKMIMDMAEAWDLEEPFDAENVGLLVQNYMGSPEAIVRTYLTELTKSKVGN